MTPTALVLLSLVGWVFLLLTALGALRYTLVLSGKRRMNSFAADGNDVAGLGQRPTRAHANCYETLPSIGLILLYAIASEQTAVTDPLAYFVLVMRIAQSLVHIYSTQNIMVIARMIFFIPQVVVSIYWLLALTGLL